MVTRNKQGEIQETIRLNKMEFLCQSVVCEEKELFQYLLPILTSPCNCASIVLQ